MHELAVCQSLIDQIEALARAEQATLVNAITVRCGPLSGIEPHLLVQAFSIARAGSVAYRAELTIEPDPVVVHCNNCQQDHNVAPNRLVCPDCGAPCPHLVSGDALILASVSIEREARPSEQAMPTT